MDMPFKPAKAGKLFQDIIEQIQDAIFTKKLIAGQKLPSERKLEKMFQASRPTIREAIRVIEDRGLIHIELGKKGGIIVNSKTNSILFNNFFLLIRSQNFSINDLAEFREKIEGEVVQTAAQKFSDLDIYQLKKILENVKKYSSRKSQSITKFIEADTKFHLKLCMIADNPIYDQLLNAIYKSNEYYKRFFILKSDVMEENLQDLIDIFFAFSNRQSQIAKKLSENHIRKFNLNY